MNLADASPAISGAFAAMSLNIPGATVIRDPEWGIQVTAPIRHPIGNFAWVQNVRKWQELDLPIGEGAIFNLYVPSVDADPGFIGGFRHALTQRTMLAEPKRRPFEARYRVDEARTGSDRRRISDFMVNLFYGSSAREVRQQMTRSIEAAQNLRLFAISDGRGGISGACALYIGHELWGIYNVIVDEDQRRSGRGHSLIAEMLAIANDSGRMTQLQCNPNLVDWYGMQGFRAHSFLHIYCI